MTATLADGRKLVREVQAGSSYLSSEDPRVHFGLGRARSASRGSASDSRRSRGLRTNLAVDRIVDVD